MKFLKWIKQLLTIFLLSPEKKKLIYDLIFVTDIEYLAHNSIKLGYSLLSHSWQKELENRKESISYFLSITLPTLNNKYENNVIIESSNTMKVNYGEILGKKAEYDFILPEIPLYLCVRGPASASWDEARQYGITRIDWENEQAYIDGLITLNNVLRDENKKAQLLIFKWNDPINYLSLLKIFEAIQ